MKEKKNFTPIINCTIILVALSIIILFWYSGFRFNSKDAVHSYYHDSTIIHTDDYDFYLNPVNNENDEPVYSDAHIAVKKYGFLYRQMKSYDNTNRKEQALVAENGDCIGYMYSYPGKEKTYHFIHWMRSATSIVDEKYTYSMIYWSDEIILNGETIPLYLNCYFETDEPIQFLQIKDSEVTFADHWSKPITAVFAPVPEDTTLEFWVTQDVASTDFSKYQEIYGWMGARQFYGSNYKTTTDTDGNNIMPKHYVTYLITAYPDYADGGQYITEINITDPAVSVYGLTTDSSFEEFEKVFQKMGFLLSYNEASAFQSVTAEKYDIKFTFTKGTSETSDIIPQITIRANVTNRENIEF